MKASVRHVLLAVEVGEASLVGESAGYIVLGAADRALVRASVAHTGSVFLDPDGQVHLDGTLADTESVEASLRQLLGELLGRVRTPCPNLERVASRRECRGLSTLVTELEAALVPVNRRAAKRSLGRLCRDAERSRHLEWARARVEPVAPRAQVDVHHGTALPAHDGVSILEMNVDEELSVDVPVEVVAVTPRHAVVTLAESAVVDDEPAASDEQGAEQGAVTTLRESAAVELFTSVHAPVHHLASDAFRSAILDELPADDAPSEGALVEEEPTRLWSPEVRDGDLLGAHDAAVDEEPTRVMALEVRESTEVREASRPQIRKVKVLGAWRSTGPDVPDDVPLVDVPDSAPARRPSDVSELLARFGRNEPARVELLEGLRQLAHVEHTPAPPPLDGSLDGERHFASPLAVIRAG